MKEIVKLGNIEEINKFNGIQTGNPLVTIVDLSKSGAGPAMKVHFELYSIFLKDAKCSAMKYGRNYYDYQSGTLVFIAPGQVVEIEEVNEKGLHQPSGIVLFFHPDLIRGTSLGQNMKDYTYFSYHVNEALHISEKERLFVLDCFEKIQTEIDRPIDKYSRKLIANTIELFLNYCIRFYDRQFIVREQANKGMVEKFETLLDNYFNSDKLAIEGLPTVAYCAEKLNISVKYFGDLIKKETGKSALEFIHLKLLEIAKERIFDTTKSVSEIAYELGFKYPQHFTRFFKLKVGVTPNEYRMN
ncbi:MULTISPECIES: AraC family transcriptional regulator [Emticicia]|uniref:helix-turn-helix domain-containing protein n=1 Tax=Emticicia TaxID=312278 RepID=UPI0007D8BBF5|nr:MULTISPECIES: helix-turn-helix domain-containing protein [Emticicia]